MGYLRLQNAFGYRQGQDDLHALVARQEAERIRQENEAYKAQIDAQKYALATRGLDIDQGNLDERRAEGTFSRLPVKRAPIRFDKSVGPDGKPRTVLRDPETYAELHSEPEYVAPDKPPPPRSLVEMNNVIDPKTGKPSTMLYDPDKGAPAYSVEQYNKPDAPAAGGAAGLSAEDIDNLAQEGFNDPDSVKLLDAKTRVAVAARMAQMVKDPENPRRKKAVQRQQEIADLVDDMLGEGKRGMAGMAGFSGSTGAKGISSLFGLKSQPIEGTDAADYRKRHYRLKALLTLDNVGILKGVLSDTDMRILASAASELSEDQKDDAYIATLRGIQSKVKNALAAGGTSEAPGRSAGGSGGAYTGETRTLPDGRTAGIVNGQPVELMKSGNGWVVRR